MNIPIPEYCTLERASKLIGYDVSDLIHLGEIGAIKICISLNYEVLADLSVLLSDEQSVSYEDDEGWVGGFYSKFVTKEDPEIESNKDRGWYNFTAVISGLWEIHKVSEYGKLENKFPNSISNLLISIDGDYAYASAKLVDLVIDFDVNELFILGVDIKKIMEFEGKRIPCLINEFEGELDTNIVTNSTK